MIDRGSLRDSGLHNSRHQPSRSACWVLMMGSGSDIDLQQSNACCRPKIKRRSNGVTGEEFALTLIPDPCRWHRRWWRCRWRWQQGGHGGVPRSPRPQQRLRDRQPGRSDPSHHDRRLVGNDPREKKSAIAPSWRQRLRSHPLAKLGPGLVTGAADNDPSGIAI
jgi:hypothetical protein